MKDGDVMDEVHSQNSVFSLIIDCMSDSGQINLNAVKSYEQIVFMGDSILITPAWFSLEKYFSTKICFISLSRILHYYYARVL